MKTTNRRLHERFEQFLLDEALVHRGDGILLAVSGGVDSMVMLDLFHRIQKDWELSLAVAHLNHGLRGEESDRDEAFVNETAAALRIPFVSERADVRAYQKSTGLSKQEAARELRYEFLERSRIRFNARSVATAHQADDNAETVLMNAIRGAGIHGLTGIPIRRPEGSIIRPLLFARRADIDAYAVEHRIAFREDSSNKALDSTRNTIRHKILPLLSNELQTDAVDSLNRVSRVMRSLAQSMTVQLNGKMTELFVENGGQIFLQLSPFRSQPLHLREEVVMRLFRRLGIEPSAAKVLAVLGLCEQPTGRTIQLSRGWHVLHDRNRLVIYRSQEPTAFEHTVEIGKEYSFPGFHFGLSRLESVPKGFPASRDGEVVDADRLGHLVLRSWRPGDWFIPLGMNDKKKLSDFFVNQKVPLIQKDATPVLESDGAIVWVCGLRLDERFKITPSTRRAILLRYSTNPQ